MLDLETLASAHLPPAQLQLSQIWPNTILQERLKAAEAKRIEKERTEKYNKLKTDAKDARAKYREKVREEDPWVYRERKSTLLVQASRESSKVWCRRGIRIWRWGGRLWAQQESGAGSNGPSVEILTKCVHLFIFYFFRSQSVGREGNVGSNGCSNPKFGQDKVLVTLESCSSPAVKLTYFSNILY